MFRCRMLSNIEAFLVYIWSSVSYSYYRHRRHLAGERFSRGQKGVVVLPLLLLPVYHFEDVEEGTRKMGESESRGLEKKVFKLELSLTNRLSRAYIRLCVGSQAFHTHIHTYFVRNRGQRMPGPAHRVIIISWGSGSNNSSPSCWQTPRVLTTSREEWRNRVAWNAEIARDCPNQHKFTRSDSPLQPRSALFMLSVLRTNRVLLVVNRVLIELEAVSGSCQLLPLGPGKYTPFWKIALFWTSIQTVTF